MYRLLLAALVASAALTPAATFAADDHMMANPATVMICHDTQSGQTPNAMMGSEGLMCRKVDMAKVHAAMAKIHAAMTKMKAGTMTPDQKAAASDLSSGMDTLNSIYYFGSG